MTAIRSSEHASDATGGIAAAGFRAQARAARLAARRLATVPSARKDEFLRTLARLLVERLDALAAANDLDLAAARRDGLGEHVIDRLRLDAGRLRKIADDTVAVAGLEDPVGERLEARTLPNGLDLERVRVPIGVIGVIYESRPNVTIDIAALCLKAGNAVVMRGGREAINSNAALAAVVRDALEASGLPADALQFVASTDRGVVDEMLEARDLLDLLIPRGGEALIQRVRDESRVPAITGGIGVCHTYVDRAAGVDEAVEIVFNAKTQRPSVCNALDTVLVHADAAAAVLPPLARRLAGAGVQLRCDSRSLAIIEPILAGSEGKACLRAAGPGDFGQEFLALVASVRVVDSLDDALAHIEEYGSGHSEAIVTADAAARERFLAEVDAAAVFANASTRFHDGGQFGLGAEIAISTDRLHARGPLGLREITSYKWIIRGDGHVLP